VTNRHPARPGHGDGTSPPSDVPRTRPSSPSGQALCPRIGNGSAARPARHREHRLAPRPGIAVSASRQSPLLAGGRSRRTAGTGLLAPGRREICPAPRTDSVLGAQASPKHKPSEATVIILLLEDERRATMSKPINAAIHGAGAIARVRYSYFPSFCASFLRVRCLAIIPEHARPRRK